MQIVRTSALVFTGGLALLLGVATGFVAEQEVHGGWILGLFVGAAALFFGLRRPYRRFRAARRKPPAEWKCWLDEHVPLYRALPPEDQARFARDMQFILAEWRFESVAGVTVTAEMCAGVAAAGALLLHGLPEWELPTFQTILFYPDRFDDAYEGGDYADFDGMAHQQGPIILSARAVVESWEHPEDGSNVVLHELAHLFDFANHAADGIPSLLDSSSIEAWEKLARREMRAASIGKSLLRRYAATNTAEFFAVSVENFFERPAALRGRHPALYEALSSVFALDPAAILEAWEDKVAGV